MDENAIRELIRAEIRAAFNELSVSADNYPGYDTDTIEDVAANVLSRVARDAEDTLSHEATCQKRAGTDLAWCMRGCTC